MRQSSDALRRKGRASAGAYRGGQEGDPTFDAHFDPAMLVKIGMDITRSSTSCASELRTPGRTCDAEDRGGVSTSLAH